MNQPYGKCLKVGQLVKMEVDLKSYGITWEISGEKFESYSLQCGGEELYPFVVGGLSDLVSSFVLVNYTVTD